MSEVTPAYLVRKRALNGGSIEKIAVGLALAKHYDPTTGIAVVTRAVLASEVHYSQKRVRTAVSALLSCGAWVKVEPVRRTDGTFSPSAYSPAGR